jgi:hypothetical protein
VIESAQPREGASSLIAAFFLVLSFVAALAR